MDKNNNIIKSMIAVPVGIIVLKESTVVERFYNNNHIVDKNQELRKEVELFIDSLSKTKLSKDNRVTSFIILDNLLSKLYSKTKHRDRYFFVFKENIVNLIYIDSLLFKEVTTDVSLLNNCKSIYTDNKVEFKLITNKEI